MYLNCHSYFSFKYGTLDIPGLLKEAQEKGISQLALTDINNTSGCLEFIRLAADYNVKPVVGIDFRDGIKQQFIGIAKNNEGFYELNHFLSGFLHEGKPISNEAPEFSNSYIIYPFTDKAYCELKDHEFIGVKAFELNKLRFSKWIKYPDKLIALQTATFRNKKDFNIHRLLRAIDNNTLLSKLTSTEQASEEDKFLNPVQIENAFVDFPFLVENANKLLSNCSIEFTFHQPKNKETYTDNAKGDIRLLRNETYKGLSYRYGALNDELIDRAEKELALIANQGFGAYFLINWDIVKYAREQGFFYVGRGSGANSIVAYALQITDVDPIDLDLYFERFINEYRKNPPDFDIDFSWKDRNAIIDYMFDKHGLEHTSLLATYSTFQSRAIIRELGKVFGLPKAEIDDLVENRKLKTTPDEIARLIHQYGRYLIDFPSHLSIHAGGVLISEKPIHCYTATNLPPKGYPLTQFSMLESEDLGLYKFDILSQRGLGHIKDTVELVKKNKGIDIDIHDIKAFKEDERIKDLLRNGKTMGCFYVESPAMRMLLKKLRVDNYLGLVAASSIIRPGVASSGMMGEYIKRYRDPNARTYIHPVMKHLMEETFGVMVYQEDVIRVAHHFAGMSLGEADVLRRGMSGKFRARDEFQKAENGFIEGCRKKGYPDKITFEVWRQVKSFAGYSFSKGHSASYAVESYQSLYLKAYYPKEFMVGVINNFGGFYRTEYYVHEARMCGAIVHPPCINNSEHLTSIKNDDIYLGFIHMANLEEKLALRIVEEREVNGLFKNLADFTSRVEIAIDSLRLLIRIGAFNFTGIGKKDLLWEMYNYLGSKRKSSPRKELFQTEVKSYTLPPLTYTPHDDALDELEILGFPLSSPFELLKEQPETKVKTNDLMSHVGENIEILGYLVCTKHTRTKNGDEMFFGTFLDKDGIFFDTTHFPQVAKRFPFRGSGCYLLKGKVAQEFEYPSVEIHYMEKVSYIHSEY